MFFVRKSIRSLTKLKPVTFLREGGSAALSQKVTQVISVSILSSWENLEMDVGNTLQSAKHTDLSPRVQVFANQIGGRDRNDYYRFTVKAQSRFNARVDRGNLSLFDQTGMLLQRSRNRQSVSQTILPGTYYVRVSSVNRRSTDYQLKMNAPWLQKNVLTVIADDFGIDASSSYNTGGAKPKLRTLESLAKNGVVFDNAWVNPVCTPTRAAIYTGKYGFRTNVGGVDDLLSTQETTIQKAVSASGIYSNAVIGKWHVAGGEPDPTHPAQMGVQYYSGFLSGALQDYSNWNGVEQGRSFRSNKYSTTFFTDKAVNWIEKQRQPWSLSLTYNAPHAPFHLPPQELRRRSLSGTPEDIRQNPQQYYFAAAEAMDAELGRLLNSMPAQTRANTVVMFIGDNGTPQRVIQSPFSSDGAKGTVKEGGVRVPLIVSGAGVTRKNQREDALVNGTDLFATIAEITGADASTGVDSLSFKDAFTNPNFQGRDYAYTELFTDRGGGGRRGNSDNQGPRNVWAIRDQRYKLIYDVTAGQEELYDLTTDLGETNNLLLSNGFTETANRLRLKATELRSSPRSVEQVL
jgi:arylsulfatase A-like enzyme